MPVPLAAVPCAIRRPPAVRFVRMRPKLLKKSFDVRGVDSIPVRVFGVDRTIIDCFRFRSLIGEDVAPTFLRIALERGRATHQALFAAADEGRAMRWIWDQVSRNKHGSELATLRFLRDATWRR